MNIGFFILPPPFFICGIARALTKRLRKTLANRTSRSFYPLSVSFSDSPLPWVNNQAFLQHIGYLWLALLVLRKVFPWLIPLEFWPRLLIFDLWSNKSLLCNFNARAGMFWCQATRVRAQNTFKKSHLRIYLTWLLPDLPLTPHLLGQESCLNLDLTKKIASNIIDKFQQLVLLYNFRLICIILDINPSVFQRG